MGRNIFFVPTTFKPTPIPVNVDLKKLVLIRKTNQMSLFVFFISLLIVAQHVSGNHVPIIRS